MQNRHVIRRARVQTHASLNGLYYVEVYDTHHAYIIIHLYVHVYIDNSVDELHDLQVLNFMMYIFLMYILLVYFIYYLYRYSAKFVKK